MLNQADFATKNLPTWCPGCGDFGIFAALKMALVELGLGPKEAVFVFGIGCHGNMFNAFRAINFEGLHGRPLPVASGIKMANHKLPVFAVSGDGDALGEGGNHFIHACRRNHDITYLIHDNQVYGLTTGQTSPTSPKGFKSKSNPDGSIDYPLNPLTLALSAGASFVARGYAGDIPHLSNLIVKAYQHKGFSVLDILQPCVTFNHINTYQTYRQTIYKIEDSYVPNDKIRAFEKATEWERTGKVPLGVFYEENKNTYEDDIEQIKTIPLALQSNNPTKTEELMAEFA